MPLSEDDSIVALAKVKATRMGKKSIRVKRKSARKLAREEEVAGAEEAVDAVVAVEEVTTEAALTAVEAVERHHHHAAADITADIVIGPAVVGHQWTVEP